MTEPDDFVILGRIGAVYGVKGWVKLISYTDPASNILQYRHLFLSAPALRRGATGPPERIEIDDSRAVGQGFAGHIRGCDDRELARQYTGRDLLVQKAALPPLEDQEFYWHQLEGLRVVNRTDEDLGRVHHLIATGANDVLVVRHSESSIDREERLIPFLRDRVILGVDLDSREIRVDWDRDF